MSLEIVALSAEHEAAYAEVVARSDHAMLYHGLRYRDFLHALIPDARDGYLVAYQNGSPTAGLPSLSRPGPYGRVANSLPFYGSHGGVVHTPEASEQARSALIARFHERNCEEEVRWATMVGNPFLPPPDWGPAPRFRDERIGQFTPLPTRGERDTVREALLDQCHQKTRNTIRKGLKQGYRIMHDGSEATLALTAAMHRENLQAIGGIAKGRAVFEALAGAFDYDADYRIYRADTAKGECAATLLLFYFKDFVEYFVPSSAESHRADQPLSALIHEAMVDAVVERGAKWWNWGGTWLSQDGVYRFKSRWGTQDLPYLYRTWDYSGDGDLTGLDAARLASGYPYFYTLPYRELPS
jgi:hypothetical protein